MHFRPDSFEPEDLHKARMLRSLLEQQLLRRMRPEGSDQDAE